MLFLFRFEMVWFKQTFLNVKDNLKNRKTRGHEFFRSGFLLRSGDKQKNEARFPLSIEFSPYYFFTPFML